MKFKDAWNVIKKEINPIIAGSLYSTILAFIPIINLSIIGWWMRIIEKGKIVKPTYKIWDNIGIAVKYILVVLTLYLYFIFIGVISLYGLFILTGVAIAALVIAKIWVIGAKINYISNNYEMLSLFEIKKIWNIINNENFMRFYFVFFIFNLIFGTIFYVIRVVLDFLLELSNYKTTVLFPYFIIIIFLLMVINTINNRIISLYYKEVKK